MSEKGQRGSEQVKVGGEGENRQFSPFNYSLICAGGADKHSSAPWKRPAEPEGETERKRVIEDSVKKNRKVQSFRERKRQRREGRERRSV